MASVILPASHNLFWLYLCIGRAVLKKHPLESNFNGVIPCIFVDLEKVFKAAFIEKTISLHFGMVIQ